MVTARQAVTHRSSTFDRTGGNLDFHDIIEPGDHRVLLAHDGPGCITHFYMATAIKPISWFRDMVLRCWWDGESTPSVEVPLGDFFCVSHGRPRPFRSAMVSVNAGFAGTFGLNAYFPMPFASARIDLENRSDEPSGYLHHIDYELYDQPLPDDVLRFHAQYRQERPTTPVGPTPNVSNHNGRNTDGAENYVALDAAGSGQMVGLHLEIDNLGGGWYGEGDDMVFVDGEPWPPKIHGTGTEEIFGGGACPYRPYAAPFAGFHLVDADDYSGLVGAYRWLVNDPIQFAESIRWTVEHGHANNYANDYSSVAYWYQTEPHRPFPPLAERHELLPPTGPLHDQAAAALFPRLHQALDRWPHEMTGDAARAHPAVFRIAEQYYRGDWARVLELLSDRP